MPVHWRDRGSALRTKTALVPPYRQWVGTRTKRRGPKWVMQLVGPLPAPAVALNPHCSYSRRLRSSQSLAPSPFAKSGKQFLGAAGIQAEETARATKKIVGTGDQREFLAGDL